MLRLLVVAEEGITRQAQAALSAVEVARAFKRYSERAMSQHP